MTLDMIPPSWRLLLFQADTVFGQPMTDQMNMGTTDAPLSTTQRLPNRTNLGAGVLRVKATAIGVVFGDWYLALFDGDNENSSNEPTGKVVLQMGTADGTESVPPTEVMLHLATGELNRLSYFAINNGGNGFSFQFDYWTYDAIEAWHRRVSGLPAMASKPGCGC